MTVFFRVFLLLVAILTSAGVAQAERRVALVIGNSGYQHVAALKNPYNDAKGMVQKLQGLDFEVVEGLDLDLSSLRFKIKEFVSKLDKADIALFYYAGHGLQVNGVNYLLPTDAQLSSQLDLEFEAVPINLILSTMEQSSQTNLVFLDACRDNPLAENLARSMGTRSAAVGRGLAKTSSGIGTLISFATQPGNVALDGEGDNSPFTSALLKHLGTPGQDITRNLISVRREVLKVTNGRQVPWENSSLTGEVVLKAKAAPVPADVTGPVSKQPSQEIELAYWDSIKTGTNIAYFENYLKRYPEGQFADIAKLRIGEINSRLKTREEEERQRQVATEIAYWQTIQNASQPELFESYLSRYPKGSYVELARLKIDLLEKQATQDAVKSQSSEGKPEGGSQSPMNFSQEVEVASLPTPAPGESAAEGKIIRTLTERELATAMQTELNRIGCSVGKVDGAWGHRSRGALKVYAKETGADLASLDPSAEILDQLKKSSGRVCPLTCGRNQELKNGKCVAAERPANKAGTSGSSKSKSQSGSTTRTSSACPSDPTADSFRYPSRRSPGTNSRTFTHPCGRKAICRAQGNLPRKCFWN
ncbi:caspase family protein [Roseibium sp. SCPC15]|uniref:caspase family protein n=1 Tax=Roseibium sp. SCP15 TaxID=3141376 RepID=UPI003336A43E